MDYSCRQESKSSHPRNHSRPTNGCKWCLVGLLPIQFGHNWQRRSFSRRGKLTGTTSELSAHVVRFPRFLSCRKIPSPNQVEWSHRVIVISKKASWIAFSPSPDSLQVFYGNSDLPRQVLPIQHTSEWSLACQNLALTLTTDLWLVTSKRERERDWWAPAAARSFFWMNYNVHYKSEACFRRGPVFITCAVQNGRVTNMLPR